MRATDTSPMAAATTWPWKKKRGTSPMVSNPKKLPSIDMKAWAIFGHIPNPFTGKVETLAEFEERRTK